MAAELRFLPAKALPLIAAIYVAGGELAVRGPARHYAGILIGHGICERVEEYVHHGRRVTTVRFANEERVQDFAARVTHGEAKARDLGEKLRARHVPKKMPMRKWPDGATACPKCACSPARPCKIVLENGCGEALCCPAGLYGFNTCSACVA